jgi:uncharacterized repeat protein (TIGR03809 family)
MPNDFRLSIESARKWHALAERRRAHLVELQRSGRWQRYYSESVLLSHLREASKDVDNWALVIERWSGDGSSGGTKAA